MKRLIVQSMVLACLGSGLSQAKLADSEPDSRPITSRFVLMKMQERLATIWNYQCTQVSLMASGNRRDPNQPPITNYSRKRLAYNRQGHGRVRTIYRNLAADTCIWDGRRAIQIQEHVKPNGTVVHSALIARGRHYQVDQGNTAWKYLGETLVNVLEKAIKKGTEISIEQTEDERYRLEIRFDYGSTVAAVLDPGRGYLPVLHETIIQGDVRRHEEVTFAAVDPGLWFPVEVRTRESGIADITELAPVCQFVNIRLNDSDFDRLLKPNLPPGSVVYDRIGGTDYIVGHKSAPTPSSDAWPTGGPAPNASKVTFDTVYSLEDGEALKRIAPPFPPGRKQYIISQTPHLADAPEAAFGRYVYVFEWDNDLKGKICLPGGLFRLTDILQYACRLDPYEYTGPDNLLSMQLSGDWIARKDSSSEERLKALARIVKEEVGMSMAFERHQITAPTIRATGTYRQRPLPQALADNDIHLFAGDPNARFNRRVGGGSGSLAQFIREIGILTGVQVIDEIEPCDACVSWLNHGSARLRPLERDPQARRSRLASLLENLTRQTGLTFTIEENTINQWQLSAGGIVDDRITMR